MTAINENYLCVYLKVHKPQKEKEKPVRVAKRKKTTWTYEDETGRDLGQDYLEQRKDAQENNVSFYIMI